MTQFTFPARWSQFPTHAAQVFVALPRVHRRPEVLAAIVEALSNAVVHGALGVASRAEGHAGLRAYAAAISERAAALPADTITVRIDAGPPTSIAVLDRGRGFDWRRTVARRGHGLAVMRAAFEEVRWNEVGNEVRLVLPSLEAAS